MKLRHAAALTLVGWFLMVPPQDPKDHAFLSQADLSTWRILKTLDTPRECEKARIAYLKGLSEKNVTFRDAKTGKEVPFPTSCIHSDDPRLKPK
jgi:hypothetical protein